MHQQRHDQQEELRRREGTRRGVIFDNAVSMRLIPPLAEFTAEERSSVWLTPQDGAETQADVRRTVKTVRVRDRRGQHIPEGGVACLRGLEHLRSVGHFEQRKVNRDVCLASLFEEQQRQRLLGIVDEEVLARASAIGSRWARELALRMGASDAAEARKLTLLEGNRSHRVRPFHSFGPVLANDADASTVASILERAKRVCDSRVASPEAVPFRDPQLRKQIVLHLRGLSGEVMERSNKIQRTTSSGQKVVGSPFVAASLLANNGPSY